MDHCKVCSDRATGSLKIFGNALCLDCEHTIVEADVEKWDYLLVISMVKKFLFNH